MSRDDLRPLIASLGLLCVGLFRWWQQWLNPAAGDVGALVNDVYHGRANAPWQYRPGAVWLEVRLASLLHISVPGAVLVVGVVSLLVGWLAVVALLDRVSTPAMVVPATLVIVVISSGTLFFDKPESYLSFALVSLALVPLLSGERRGLMVLVVLALLLIPVRDDLTATLGVALLWRGWRCRRVVDAVVGVAVGAASVVGFELMRLEWPHAHYGISVVQVGHNFSSPNFAIPVGLALVVLGSVRRVPRAFEAALVWLAVYSASVLVVGRVDELRLWMPMAAVIALAVVLGIEEQLGSRRERPRL